MTGGMNMPGGVGYEEGAYGPTPSEPTTITDQNEIVPEDVPPPSSQLPPGAPADLLLPPGAEPAHDTVPPSGASLPAVRPTFTGQPEGALQSTAPRPYSPARPPVFVRNTGKPDNRQQSNGQTPLGAVETGLLGPVGYDVE
jgi:hypothetical protein